MNNHQVKEPVTLPESTIKKPYETPEIQAIVIEKQPSLLSVSGGFGASRSGYGEATDEEW